jgi:hypothetical protein
MQLCSFETSLQAVQFEQLRAKKEIPTMCTLIAASSVLEIWMFFNGRVLRLRNQKVANHFIHGGITLNDISFQVGKLIGNDL